jgi:hypothetical protein
MVGMTCFSLALSPFLPLLPSPFRPSSLPVPFPFLTVVRRYNPRRIFGIVDARIVSFTAFWTKYQHVDALVSRQSTFVVSKKGHILDRVSDNQG